MTSQKIRILMATDIPFWNAKTGAEQRMFSLVEYFNCPPFQLTTFFLGKVTAEDLLRIDQKKLSVRFFESERPPEAFVARMKWYADATRNQLQKWMSRGKSPATEDSDRAPLTPLRLDDYKWPWAVEQFRQEVARLRPQIVIAQYITMAYLIEGLPPKVRKEIHCVLDTHDILHERGMQFGAAGYLHWLEVGLEEESRTWDQFDTVLAIQENEAELIRKHVSHPQVMVVGHAPQLNLNLDTVVEQPNKIRLGYIGSANYSNWHAINRFLIEVWPDLLAQPDVEVELIVAGKICSWIEMQDGERLASLKANNIALIGEIDELRQFYDAIDIALNPVLFGTGLKIKNVEALAFGKPLVTTNSGASGMTSAAQQACYVVSTLSEMSTKLVNLCKNSEQRLRLASVAKAFAKSEFSANSIYSELAKHFTEAAQTQPSACHSP